MVASLLAFADHQFERLRTAADGNDVGDHIDAAKRHPLYKAEESVAPTLPFELTYIWEWFAKLSQKRQNGMGVNPLASTEILAWQKRYRIRFDPFEESVIDRLDQLFTHHQNKKAT